MAQANGNGNVPPGTLPLLLRRKSAERSLEIGDRELLFVGGKGGVGKTTTAGAVATWLAESGERTLLVSTDPAHSLSDLLDRDVGDPVLEIRPGLWGLEVDPELQVDRYLSDVKRTMREFVRPEMYDEIDRQMELTRSAPGAVEAAMLDRITEITVEDSDRYDRLVFDTAPTGHTLRLLSLPEVMGAWMDGLLESRDRSERFSEMLRETDWEGGDELSYVDRPERSHENQRARRIREILGERQRKFRRARRLFTDSERAGFILVTNPSKLAVRETQRITETLDELGVPVLALVVNKVLPGDVESEFLDSRRNQEAQHLRRIDELFGHLSRIRVPLMAEDVTGFDGLQRFAGHLGIDAA